MKKTSSFSLHSLCLASSLLILFLLLPESVFAVEPNEAFLFQKLAVLDTDDSTGKALGKKIGKITRSELEQIQRFDIIPPEKVRIQHPFTPQSLEKIGSELQVDGFIVSRVYLSNETLNISLEIRDSRGDMFALELLAVNEQASRTELENSIRELVARLIRRIPYKAVITEVDRDMVTFDAGRVNGVEIGSNASIFEIIEVKRHPFTNEIISFTMDDLGVINVTQVEARTAAGRMISSKKGGKINAGQKVDFSPSERVIRESRLERRLTKETPVRPRGSLDVGTGFLLNDYEINSNQFNFKRDTSPVPVAAVTGEYWILAPIGVDVSYAASWIYFNQTDSVPRADASLSWLGAHLKYRHFLSSVPLSPEITGSIGYHVYEFEVDQSDLNFFNNIKYSGIDLALAAGYPMTSKIKGVLNVGYRPSLNVRERPVTSGTNPSADGYLAGLTGYFKVFERTALKLGYYYQAYHLNFSGTGTRGVGTTNAEIKDIYHGINLSVVYDF